MKSRILLASALIALSNAAPESIDKINQDIAINQSKIAQNDKEKQKINSILDELGVEINQERAKMRSLTNELKKLEISIKQNTARSKAQSKRVKELEKTLLSLENARSSTRDKIIKILLNDASFVIILQERGEISVDDLMLSEIYKALNVKTKSNLKRLAIEQNKLGGEIQHLLSSIASLNAQINEQKAKETRYQALLSDQKKLLDKIKSDLKVYNAKLEGIEKERANLNELLANLNILKQREQKAPPKNAKNNYESIKVKQVATSYKRSQIAKYNGKKTIPPFDNYKITQKFGNYLDPIYNLRVFNDSVTLEAQRENTSIRSIFDGRVVYAKEVALLKKVVIIENHDGIHTIYAQLDKIAPTIKPGVTVKKGYVIGRIKDKLGFEITQRDKHLNPLDVIY